jgi:RimJ/RimL family protein N-acetyltransferase
MPDPRRARSVTPAGASIPTLATERLTLRGHTLADFADCVALWSDPRVTGYIGGQPLAEEEVWSKLLRYRGHWSLLGFGYWVVTETASGRFVGEVGFADFKRAIEPPLGDAPEHGWVLAAWAHGKGFATEAVSASLAWAAAAWGSRRTVCLVHPENRASLRVAAKTGYRERLRTTYKSAPVIVFER